jgi:hypothetical protein
VTTLDKTTGDTQTKEESPATKPQSVRDTSPKGIKTGVWSSTDYYKLAVRFKFLTIIQMMEQPQAYDKICQELTDRRRETMIDLHRMAIVANKYWRAMTDTERIQALSRDIPLTMSLPSIPSEIKQVPVPVVKIESKPSAIPTPDFVVIGKLNRVLHDLVRDRLSSHNVLFLEVYLKADTELNHVLDSANSIFVHTDSVSEDTIKLIKQRGGNAKTERMNVIRFRSTVDIDRVFETDDTED